MQILEHILKIRREKAKHEFSQTVGNQLATIWHCEMWFANFALRISHCQILQPQNTVHLSHTKMQNLCENSHCQIYSQIRNQFRIAKFAVVFRIAKFRIAKFAVVFRIAKFAMWFFALRNSLWFFALRNFALRNSLWFFALRNSQHIANSLKLRKIPTVLPSDFVLRITFSSELRFRCFWYRWKA